MTSLTDVVASCREDYLLAGARERKTQLNGALSDSATSVVVDSSAGITAGTRISVNYEEMHVWSVAGTTLTVLRGEGGTTAAAHADNDVVVIDPEYSDGRIRRAIEAVVEDLRHEPGLYRIGYLDWTPPHTEEMPIGASPDESSEVGYDGVLEVLLQTDDDEAPWVRADSWDVIQVASSDATPEPVVIVHGIGGFSNDVRIVLRQTLGQITGSGNNLEDDIGILNTDILAVGAALRLGAGRAMRRTSLHTQGDARRANEVAPFSTTSATRDLERRYKRLVNAERIRLMRRFPIRRKQR